MSFPVFPCFPAFPSVTYFHLISSLSIFPLILDFKKKTVREIKHKVSLKKVSDCWCIISQVSVISRPTNLNCTSSEAVTRYMWSVSFIYKCIRFYFHFVRSCNEDVIQFFNVRKESCFNSVNADLCIPRFICSLC
jgi:hypothetical protein